MFAKKTNDEIGLHLKSLILRKFPSVRQFCVAYLKLDNGDPTDQTIVRNLSNRFSQIIKGKKAIQTYDLPIITELLGISCEDLLSCGETKVALNYRKTNYNVAYSDKESDWVDLLNREDCIAAYSDEFGKTVLDYAIEFKNYRFIKYLIDKDYITLISDRPGWDEFGAESKIKERPYDNRLRDEFYTNKLLRTKILSLAIANNDIESLEKFKARELPPQQGRNGVYSNFNFSDYYDESFVKEISISKEKVFNYFLDEYTSNLYGENKEIVWLFPFISELVEMCLKNKDLDRAIKTIKIIKEHNKNVFDQLKKTFLLAAKRTKDEHYFNRSFQDAINEVKHYYHISECKNFVSFNPYYLKDVPTLAFSINHINCVSKNPDIQSLINESNEIFEKILYIPNHLIKNS